MEQEGQIIHGYCYACFTGTSTPIDEDLMTKFANAVSPASVKIEKSFTDKRNKKAPRNRPGWNAMLMECQIEGISHIVIPAMSMLSYHLSLAIEVAREVRKKYNIKIHFLYEDIYTGGEETDQELYMGLLSTIDYEQHRKDRLNSLERGYGPFWEQRMDVSCTAKGAVGYIGFMQKSKVCSNDRLVSFLRTVMPDVFEIKAAYSDYGKKGKFIRKEGWTQAVLACESPEIGLLILSSTEVIGDSIMDIVAFTKRIKEKNGVETYFLLEDIYTGDKNYEASVTLHCSAADTEDKLNKRKEKMKTVFREIAEDYTGSNSN